MDQALAQAFTWMDGVFAELELPGVSRGRFMGRPALRHRGKAILGSKDGKVLVVHCPVEVKEMLIAADPETYFQTAHYEGWPALLLRPDRVSRDILADRIMAAWRMSATQAQIRVFEARGNN